MEKENNLPFITCSKLKSHFAAQSYLALVQQGCLAHAVASDGKEEAVGFSGIKDILLLSWIEPQEVQWSYLGLCRLSSWHRFQQPCVRFPSPKGVGLAVHSVADPAPFQAQSALPHPSLLHHTFPPTALLPWHIFRDPKPVVMA